MTPLLTKRERRRYVFQRIAANVFKVAFFGGLYFSLRDFFELREPMGFSLLLFLGVRGALR